MPIYYHILMYKMVKNSLLIKIVNLFFYYTSNYILYTQSTLDIGSEP